MIIGVDRLDCSKGVPLRMEAFDRFLSTHPEWRGKVTYLQITPKSRSEIREYADMQREIDETAGRVNGTYGEASWTPIRYVNRAHSRSALAGLYRSAKAALVTPLRDGMNLVAKEYVAAQDSEDPGSSFYRDLQALPWNARRHFLSIHTILNRLGLLLARRCQCRWRSAAVATTRSSEC
jgi:trehalose 6-phosphate synthase